MTYVDSSDVSKEIKTGYWEKVSGVLTPGGDPLYRCPFCKSRESEHLNGVEYPQHREVCPHCGAKLQYGGKTKNAKSKEDIVMQSKASTNKIVKALKCCVKKNCSTCPLGATGNPYCEEDVKAAAADIIKSLQEGNK